MAPLWRSSELSKPRHKPRNRSVSTGPEFPALLFSNVAFLVNGVTARSLEFPRPLTHQEMFDYMEEHIPSDLIIPGFIAFSTTDVVMKIIDPDVPDQKAVEAALEAAFVPKGYTGLLIVQDPVKGPCIQVPVDEDGNADLPTHEEIGDFMASLTERDFREILNDSPVGPSNCDLYAHCTICNAAHDLNKGDDHVVRCNTCGKPTGLPPQAAGSK
jgi:hypothetical protein